MVRQRLLEEHRKKREEKNRIAMARSQAPVKKKVGKPVMWRSRPVDTKAAEVALEDNDSEVDDAEFFTL